MLTLSHVLSSVAVNAMMAGALQKRREQPADPSASHQHLNHGSLLIRNRSLDHTLESMGDIKQMIQTRSILVHPTSYFVISQRSYFWLNHLRFQVMQAPQQQRQLPLHLATLYGKESLLPSALCRSTLAYH